MYNIRMSAFVVLLVLLLGMASCQVEMLPQSSAEATTATAASMGTDFNLQEGEFGFAFVSRADAEPNAAGQKFVAFMSGSGVFDDQEVHGGGTFDLWDVTQEQPQQMSAAGHWRAVKRIDFSLPDIPVTGAGVSQSGILDVEIVLFPVGGPEEGVPASLRIVCNVPSIPAMTGLPEGVFLDIEEFPGLSESLALAPATFPETSFPLGLTTFLREPDISTDQ